MPLGFPNESRFYDAAVHAVRFSGYDGAMEAPFFVDERALKQIQPDMPSDEAGLLQAARGFLTPGGVRNGLPINKLTKGGEVATRRRLLAKLLRQRQK